MPGFDGTGPMGTGPIGGGRGPCGRGGAFGWGRGFGRGMGWGGRGRRGWFGGQGRGAAGFANAAAPETEREGVLAMLKQQAEDMEQSLAAIRDEIKALMAPKSDSQG